LKLDLEQIRRHVARPAAPGSPEQGGARHALLQSLRRELTRIEGRRPRPPAHRPPPTAVEGTPPADAAAVEQVGLPDPVDEEGMVYREDLAPGHAFGRARMERPSAELLLLLEHLLALEGQWRPGQQAPLRPQDLLFFDLETTGLSRSAGTFPFLTGLGAWLPDAPRGAFRVDQLLLRDPSLEPLALKRLGEHLARARVLISYNGRTFDLPVLRNRDLLNRAGLDLDGRPHLDLLHLCRRLFRARVDNCRLATMEQALLGYRRQGDVDGAEAPRIYADFLRTGRSDELARILEHNRLDVALMAPLLLLVVRHAMDPLHWGEDGEELLGAARLHMGAGAPGLGEACLRRGLELARAPATRRRVLAALARHERRRGRPHAAGALWEQFRREFPDHDVGWTELAKYHEHVTKDLPRALDLAERAPLQHRQEHQHRLQRLRRRVARLEERSTAS
jgi:uncharacterized protein YprB with RNaseH-like and TPR domain